jgi:diaminopimelate epimerase
VNDPNALAARLCDRHFGIGADGLILALPSPVAHARMRILNSDGSEAEMCGNGLRCAAKFLRDAGICDQDDMTIDTLAGVLRVQLADDGVTADMGEPSFIPEQIPVAADSNANATMKSFIIINLFCAITD